MAKRRSILMVQLRRQARQELQRRTAQVGLASGLRAMDLYPWKVEARTMVGQGPGVGDYLSAHRRTAPRRRRGRSGRPSGSQREDQ